MAKGDHIYVNCNVRGIPFQHHGIDMGDGTVIHLAPASGSRFAIRDDSTLFTVRRDTLEDFCQGQNSFVVEHQDPRPADAIAAAAEECLGDSGYSLLEGNCEHFATRCATGRHESHQIEMGEATVSAFTSLATKAAWTASARWGGRLVARSTMKVHPAAMLADGVELLTLAATCKSGLNAKRSRQLAKASGTLAAAGIGGVLGGPAGAAVCVATHTSSGAVADQVCRTLRKWFS